MDDKNPKILSDGGGVSGSDSATVVFYLYGAITRRVCFIDSVSLSLDGSCGGGDGSDMTVV